MRFVFVVEDDEEEGAPGEVEDEAGDILFPILNMICLLSSFRIGYIKWNK